METENADVCVCVCVCVWAVGGGAFPCCVPAFPPHCVRGLRVDACTCVYGV